MANIKYIYIDECGDPEFYGHRKKLLVGTSGYHPLLLIGMIVTDDRRKLWEEVSAFQKEILNDPLYNTIHSVSKLHWYLHANSDYPDIRSKFFEKIRDMNDFLSYIVIGRKDLNIFNRKHNNSSIEFYFDILHHLLKGKINDDDTRYKLYLSQRKKSNMQRFKDAVEKGFEGIKVKIDYSCSIVKSSVTPELSIIDYLMWALQRYIIKKEDRFYNAVIQKYTEILDLYDEKGEMLYIKGNEFRLSKTSEFKI